MTCTYSAADEDLAEAGLSDEEIRDLRQSIDVARQTAKADGYAIGLMGEQQRALQDRAESRAREDAHDRHHRMLEDFLNSLPKGDAKTVAHAHAKANGGHLSATERDGLKKLFD